MFLNSSGKWIIAPKGDKHDSEGFPFGGNYKLSVFGGARHHNDCS